MEEVCSLSPKLTLETHDIYTERGGRRARRRQDTLHHLLGGGAAPRQREVLRHPAGYEFSAFLEGIIGLSRGVSPMRVPTRKALRRLQEDVHIQVFVTPG